MISNQDHDIEDVLYVLMLLSYEKTAPYQYSSAPLSPPPLFVKNIFDVKYFFKKFS